MKHLKKACNEEIQIPGEIQKEVLLQAIKQWLKEGYDAERAAMRRSGESNQEITRRQAESQERMSVIRRRQIVEISESWGAFIKYQERLRIAEIKLSTHNCTNCGVLLYSGETSSFCCLNGKIGLAPLPPLPVELRRIFEDRDFRSHARSYNHFFAFSAMGVDGKDGFIQLPVPSCVKIHGRTYHKISGNTSTWMIHDPLERNLGNGFSQEILDTIDVALRRVNPFVNQFEMLGRH